MLWVCLIIVQLIKCYFLIIILEMGINFETMIKKHNEVKILKSLKMDHKFMIFLTINDQFYS